MNPNSRSGFTPRQDSPGRPDRPQRRAGFTLVELLIGAALSAMVMTAMLSSYVYLAKNFVRLTNQQTLENEGRRTLAYFTHDVQMATGIENTLTVSATRCSLTVAAATGTNIITYYYNSTAISGSTVSDNVTINGSSISMQREALTRCVYNGSTVVAQTLLRNITSNGLNFYYYDTSGNIYTVYTDYLPGIKQLMLQFNTQAGNSTNGTQTIVYQLSSNRLIVRNKAVLP